MMTKSLMGLAGKNEQVTMGIGVASLEGRVQAEPTEGRTGEVGLVMDLVVVAGEDSADEVMMTTRTINDETISQISRPPLILSFQTRRMTSLRMTTARNQFGKQASLRVPLTTTFP
jgi:hypothetical protein